MTYTDNQTTLATFINIISFGDLQKNAIRAANNAGITENEYGDYLVISVDGYYNIVKITDKWQPIEIDTTVYPFDDKRIYPMQQIEQVIRYKQF